MDLRGGCSWWMIYCVVLVVGGGGMIGAYISILEKKFRLSMMEFNISYIKNS